MLDRVGFEASRDRDGAKQLVIAVLQGGDAAGSQFAQQLREELYAVIVPTLQRNTRFETLWRECAGDRNAAGRFVALAYQQAERELLDAMVAACRARGYEVDVLVFDGFMVRRRTPQGRLPAELLEACAEHARAVTGLAVQLAEKPLAPTDADLERAGLTRADLAATDGGLAPAGLDRAELEAMAAALDADDALDDMPTAEDAAVPDADDMQDVPGGLEFAYPLSQTVLQLLACTLHDWPGPVAVLSQAVRAQGCVRGHAGDPVCEALRALPLPVHRLLLATGPPAAVVAAAAPRVLGPAPGGGWIVAVPAGGAQLGVTAADRAWLGGLPLPRGGVKTPLKLCQLLLVQRAFAAQLLRCAHDGTQVFAPHPHVPGGLQAHGPLADWVNSVLRDEPAFACCSASALAAWLERNDHTLFPRVPAAALRRDVVAFRDGYYDLPAGEFRAGAALAGWAVLVWDAAYAAEAARPTPHWDRAVRQQLRAAPAAPPCAESVEVLQALLGRLLLPANTDGWAVMPYVHGAPNTIKSIVVDLVCRWVPADQREGLNSTHERKFGLQTAYDKMLVFCADAPERFQDSLPPDLFKCMVTGDQLSGAVKGSAKFTARWRPATLFVGNHPLFACDQHGDLAKRIVVIPTPHRVAHPDPAVKRAIVDTECVAVLVKCLASYRELRAACAGGTLLDRGLPPLLAEARREQLRAANPAVHFLTTSDRLERRQGAACACKDLADLLAAHCRAHGLPAAAAVAWRDAVTEANAADPALRLAFEPRKNLCRGCRRAPRDPRCPCAAGSGRLRLDAVVGLGRLD